MFIIASVLQAKGGQVMLPKLRISGMPEGREGEVREGEDGGEKEYTQRYYTRRKFVTGYNSPSGDHKHT